MSELEQRVVAFKARLDRFLADLGVLATVQHGLIEDAAEIEAEFERVRAACSAPATLF